MDACFRAVIGRVVYVVRFENVSAFFKYRKFKSCITLLKWLTQG